METEVIQAAIEWWRTKRPVDWGEETHLINPLVKLTTSAEKMLALAVASYLRQKEVRRDV